MKKTTLSLAILLSFVASYAAMPGGSTLKCKHIKDQKIKCKLNKNEVVLKDQNALDSLFNSSSNIDKNKFELDGIRYKKGTSPQKAGMNFNSCEPGWRELF